VPSVHHCLTIVIAAACSAAPEAAPHDGRCRIGDRDVAWTAQGIAELDAVVRECPPASFCGEGRSVEVKGELGPGVDGTLLCLDARQRYDGPAIGVGIVAERRVWFRGGFHHEAPAGAWSCNDVATGERLDLEIDGVSWARSLWGIGPEKLDEMAFAPGGKHLAPLPLHVCPPGDWAALARDGFVVPGLEHLGDMSRLGVVAKVRYTPAR
jgi:hypothetical protein